MIKGARHRRLDKLEDMRLQAVMSAHMSNGKKSAGKIKKIDDTLKKERKMINETESSKDYEQEKSRDFNKRVQAVKRRAMQKWLDKKREQSVK
ncbi:hypothetical protein [Salinicoccus albus]|uniref:hypothetical protein n=1 Tax=Salinicoccus albus TaxID=418756 RepID=UPI0003A12E72|nr:hypothetical protein [Salinicoccus albus]